MRKFVLFLCIIFCCVLFIGHRRVYAEEADNKTEQSDMSKPKDTIDKYVDGMVATPVERFSVVGEFSWDDNRDPYLYVKDIKYGDGRPVTSYVVSFVDDKEPDYYLVGKQTVALRIKNNLTGQTIFVDSALHVRWGSSIVVDLVNFPAPLETSGYVLTLHQKSEPWISATYGNNDSFRANVINNFFATYYKGMPYLSTKVYSHFDTDTDITSRKPDYEFNLTGEKTIKDSYGHFGNNQNWGMGLFVNYGDIVSQYVFSQGNDWYPDNNNLMINEIKTKQNKGLDTVYYEVIPSGFQTLHFNQLVPKEKKCDFGMSNAQLDSKIDEYLSLEDYKRLRIRKFVKYPDTSKVGKTEAILQVEETTLYGRRLIYNYKVPFIVEDTRELTAEPNPQTTTLGRDTSTFDYTKFVYAVKFDGIYISGDKYTVELVNQLSTDTVGTKTAKVRVTKKPENKFIDVDVPVTVGWGNSVVYGSYDLGGTDRTSAAFTLYTDTVPYIVASQGNEDDNLMIHENFSNEPYYMFNWFDLSSKQSIKMDENNNGEKFIKANGNDLKKDKLKEWGVNQIQNVNYGDIVRAWVVEPSKNWLYENGQKQTYNDDKKAVYYEITSSGYSPLHFNQLTSKSGSVAIYSTHEYLNQHISDYIDLKGYKNITVKGFSEYPNTKVSGPQKAKIIIEETLTTGKKVEYEYEVTLNVESGDLSYSVPNTLTFKEFSKSRDEQIVQRKYSGNLGLMVKDTRGANSQGNWKLMAKVKNDLDSLAPYLVYRDKNQIDSYLNGNSVLIYSQEKQTDANGPLEVEVSSEWSNNTGILLKIPSKNNLSSQKYSTTITWNLVEGP